MKINYWEEYYKKQGGDETYTPYSSYDAGKQIINEELIKKGYTAENYPEIAGIIKSNRMNNPGEVSDELRNRPVSPSDIAGYLGTNIESSSEDSIYNQNIRGTSAYEDIYEKKIKATIPQLDDEYGWYDTVRQKDTGGTYGKRTEYDEDFALSLKKWRNANKKSPFEYSQVELVDEKTYDNRE